SFRSRTKQRFFRSLPRRPC
ncbi:AAA domain family protein, partial [Chlamydia psittaci 06-1683]